MPRDNPLVRVVLSQILIALVTIIGVRAHANAATVGFALFITILIIAVYADLTTSLISSVSATACYNFFFLPPFHTFTIADPQNWVALTAFFITALAVGQLSARAKHQADEAEAGRVEIRRLYEDLQNAFERASEASERSR